MQAAQFIASADAAAGPLFAAGTRVGERIEKAVRASFDAAGCNTNLGIVLLCAPIAAAIERPSPQQGFLTAAALNSRIEAVLVDLDIEDARAAYRAIAMANPGGLGRAPNQDVHAPPSLNLRQAMALAADRDLIARQYRDGYADLFGPVLASLPVGFALGSGEPSAADIEVVQQLYLTLLSSRPDSHIVRKHGEAVAQNVMSTAQGLLRRHPAPAALDADPQWSAWDAELKARAVNPGTTADLTVTTLLLAGMSVGCGAR